MTGREGPRRTQPPSIDEARSPEQPRDGASLERSEEQLAPHVTRHRAGGVQVRKRVVEEPEEFNVTVRHDELDLDRQPADRALEAGETPVTERGDTTVVLVIEERLEIRKVPWVVEEIHLRRRTVSEEQRVVDTVRKERFEIEPEGDVEQTTDS